MMDNTILPQFVPVFENADSRHRFDHFNVSGHHTATGGYNPFTNNCITFCHHFLDKLRTLNSKGFWGKLMIKKELMEEYLTKDHLISAAEWWRDFHVSKLLPA